MAKGNFVSEAQESDIISSLWTRQSGTGSQDKSFSCQAVRGFSSTLLKDNSISFLKGSMRKKQNKRCILSSYFLLRLFMSRIGMFF